MNVDITGRNVRITAGLRGYTESRLAKLERLLGGQLEAHVVLSIEKHRHSAEIQVAVGGVKLAGTEVSSDLYASIGEVADKLERQAVKHKDKSRRSSRRESVRDPERTAEPPIATATSGEAGPVLRSRSYRLKPMTAEEALLELEERGEDVLMFREARSLRINVVYRARDGAFTLIDPEI